MLERTGTQDDGAVFMPIDAAREYFNRPDQLTILGIKLKQFNGIRMREFEARWLKLPEVQVVGLQQVKSTLVSLVATAQTMIAAVAAIAVIVALIGVINTILMSVYERTSEIGIMKALGARRGAIFQLIWLETVMICLAGGLAGRSRRSSAPASSRGRSKRWPTSAYRARSFASRRASSASRCWARWSWASSAGSIPLGARPRCARSKRSAKESDMNDVIIEARGLKRYYQPRQRDRKGARRRGHLDPRRRDRRHPRPVRVRQDDADQSAVLPRRAHGRRR